MASSTIFLLLLVLACPLMMRWMMRAGHGHGGHDSRRERVEEREREPTGWDRR